MGHKIFQEYLLKNNIDENTSRKKYCREAYSFGDTVWRSREIVNIPFTLRKANGGETDTLWTDVLIMEGNVPFLLGANDQTRLDFNLKLGKRTLIFSYHGITYEVNLVRKSRGSNHVRVELWSLLGSSTEAMEVFIANSQEEDPDTPVNTYQDIKRLHKICNHKSTEGMIYGYKNAKWFNDKVEKHIERVVKGCNNCLLQKRLPSTPKVTLPKATKLNEVTAIDLKQMGKHYILYVVCTLTRFIQGMVINNKEMTTIVAALHQGWCMRWEIPIRRLYADNGSEFRNILMDEYCAKMGITIRFGPAWSPKTPPGKGIMVSEAVMFQKSRKNRIIAIC